MILWGTLQLIPEGLRAMVRAHDGAFFGDLRPEGRTLLEKFMDCLSWEGSHTGAGKECEESLPGEEGAAKTMCAS